MKNIPNVYLIEFKADDDFNLCFNDGVGALKCQKCSNYRAQCFCYSINNNFKCGWQYFYPQFTDFVDISKLNNEINNDVYRTYQSVMIAYGYGNCNIFVMIQKISTQLARYYVWGTGDGRKMPKEYLTNDYYNNFDDDTKKMIKFKSFW